MANKTGILYLTRNGMLEPLAGSQVLAYLRGLAQDHAVSLVSFEKPEDRSDGAAVAGVRSDCEEHGIRWVPRRFPPLIPLFCGHWGAFLPSLAHALDYRQPKRAREVLDA